MMLRRDKVWDNNACGWSLAGYILKWFKCPADKYTQCRGALQSYARSVDGDELDKFYAMIEFARAQPDLYVYQGVNVDFKARSKSIDVANALRASGVDVDNYTPYRVAYIGECSSLTANKVAEEMYATHVCDIMDASDNSVVLALAISSLHKIIGHNSKFVEEIGRKMVRGGEIVIREHDIHTNRGINVNPDSTATAFMDLVSVAHEIIERAGSILIPSTHYVHTNGTYIVHNGGAKIAVLNEDEILSYDDDYITIRYNHECAEVIINNVEGAHEVTWAECKKYIDTKNNLYKTIGEWDKIFREAGFDTSCKIPQYGEDLSNPHKVFYKTYRKL
jgi:hypothetical protein